VRHFQKTAKVIDLIDAPMSVGDGRMRAAELDSKRKARQEQRQIRGSLHCAADDETVRCCGRDDDFSSTMKATYSSTMKAMGSGCLSRFALDEGEEL
jgi:hypothetical protein